MVYLSQLNPVTPPWLNRSVLVPSAWWLLGLEQAARADETRHRNPVNLSAQAWRLHWLPPPTSPAMGLPQRGKTEIITHNFGLASESYCDTSFTALALLLKLRLRAPTQATSTQPRLSSWKSDGFPGSRRDRLRCTCSRRRERGTSSTARHTCRRSGALRDARPAR